ncbi:unnamed protein product [Linum tenue]|uniref:Uncharacterized protein n=1 Tax=Linum tenue TaxID=586396 RepID=A0AAV0H5H0_9ROSI|nr:unnamed protein product [Linum tenue]
MAFSSTGLWKRSLNSLGGGKNTNTFAISTLPKMKPYSLAADRHQFVRKSSSSSSWWPPRGEYAPVYVALGFIVLSASMGLHMVAHQILYSPSVRVKKSWGRLCQRWWRRRRNFGFQRRWELASCGQVSPTSLSNRKA